MNNQNLIRILEKDKNQIGDLFGRLMADLFIALGYEQPRINIHKSGRELDLFADHRLETRRAIGECKATKDAIGGSDLNKFVGVLDAEADEKHPLTGYFISLGGFTESAIEQEKHRSRTRVITLTGAEVVDELVKGRILISKERATELSGRCCTSLEDCILDPSTELLAHKRGWIWVIYYMIGHERTHFTLIHSDGTPLARAIADEVINSDRECGGVLTALTCLNPLPKNNIGEEQYLRDAIASYRQYLSNECGDIQLDGLPADSDVGSRRLKLENLFVPMHLDVKIMAGGEWRKIESQTVGTVLTDHPRLALLASPGGGKSTLLKRLAVAYADPVRRETVSDNLPAQNWLPLFFRCRELRGLARGSFADLLETLSQREPVRQYAAIFREYVDRELLAGRVLLLVDGLDEISEPGDRAAFVCTIRTALQAYPGIATVITSREAGFRHVASHLAPVCTHATVSTFDNDDIRRLSVAWHKEVVGDTEKVRTDAEQLAQTIVQNDRIKRLAVNPLLLTTLLLVKRWVGSLPTRRAVLYGKAVEVLLMTWNTEGHEPIPEEEALPQLCYVASAMMLSKVERISRKRLAVLIQESREYLPTELGYVKGTVDEFIHRIEDRSSLLMMTGHDVEDGQLVEFFEYRHLTFQEFLAARAMVDGWHPGRREQDTLASVLAPHFEDEKWREVIPLAAVLGGKATEALIQRLTVCVSIRENSINHIDIDNDIDVPLLTNETSFIALGNCLADEVAVRPETIRAAVHELVRLGTWLHGQTFSTMLCRGRYGAELQEAAEKAFMSATVDIANPADALIVNLLSKTYVGFEIEKIYTEVMRFNYMLQSQELLSRCEGALGMGSMYANVMDKKVLNDKTVINAVAEVLKLITPLLFVDSLQAQASAAYALSQLTHSSLVPFQEDDLFDRLLILWRKSSNDIIQGLAARALVSQPINPRIQYSFRVSLLPEEIEFLFKSYDELKGRFDKPAALVVGWYLNALSDIELKKRAHVLLNSGALMSDKSISTLKMLLIQLGEKSEIDHE
jgi:hypothetical protein